MMASKLRLLFVLLLLGCGSGGDDSAADEPPETSERTSLPASGRAAFLGRWTDGDGWTIDIDTTHIRVLGSDGTADDASAYWVATQAPSRFEGQLESDGTTVALTVERSEDGIVYTVDGERVDLVRADPTSER